MSVNAIPVLDSVTSQWDLALDRQFTTNVVEAYQANVALVGGENPGVYKQVDTTGRQGQFIQKAPNPEPEESYIPGTDQQGQAYGNREDFISLDDPLSTHAWFREDHVLQAHWDVIGSNAVGMGEALARKVDKRAFVTLANAARSGAQFDSQNNLQIHSGGNRVIRVGSSLVNAYDYVTSASTAALRLRSDLDDMCQRYDEANVPREGRVAYISPFAHRVARGDTGIFDMMFAQSANPNNLPMATIGMIAGFKIVMVNDRLPNTNISSAAVPSKYRGNFSIGAQASAGTPVVLTVGGVAGGRAPVGMRQLGGLRLENIWRGERRSWFRSATLYCGFGVMHPYTAGSIEVCSS